MIEILGLLIAVGSAITPAVVIQLVLILLLTERIDAQLDRIIQKRNFRIVNIQVNDELRVSLVAGYSDQIGAVDAVSKRPVDLKQLAFIDQICRDLILSRSAEER